MAFFSPEQVAEFAKRQVRLDLLVEFRFASETMRVWNGNTALETGGNTYLPMYGYGSIDGLGMGAGTASESITFQMSGLPSKALDFLGMALDASHEVDQRVVIVSLQLFDEEWQPLGVPAPIFWGFMQPPRISRTEMNGTEGAIQSITMTAENALFNRSRPAYGRYTDRDQQVRSSGDRFFQFTPSLLHKVFTYPDY
jgi:hypothetical protein